MRSEINRSDSHVVIVFLYVYLLKFVKIVHLNNIIICSIIGRTFMHFFIMYIINFVLLFRLTIKNMAALHSITELELSRSARNAFNPE